MDITNPQRILLIGYPDAGQLDLLKDLTGSLPNPLSPDTLAGTSHRLRLQTPYYTATVPIWLDIISTDDPSAWSADFAGPEACEVLRAIGAFVVVFRKPITGADLEGIRRLLGEVAKVVRQAGKVMRDGGAGGGFEGVTLAVGTRQEIVPNLDVGHERWEEICADDGWEWVDGEGRGKNEFNELQGLARLREALESNDWAGDNEDEDFDLDELEEESSSNGFASEVAEHGLDMFGLRDSITQVERAGDIPEDPDPDPDGDGKDVDIDGLEDLMLRMQAVKDMSVDLPDAERRRFAAKAVRDIMKTI